MSTADELTALELEGWRTLSIDRAHAVAFYAHALDHDALMLLPGGLRLRGRDAIVESLATTPWTEYSIADLEVLEPVADVGVVAYEVRARREDVVYRALVTSTYARRRGAWHLVVHQQTPHD